MKESLSALLDGECGPAELDRLLAEMDRDPELREHFSRLCLARDSRMGVRVRTAELDLASRVLAALQDEPEVVVPFGNRVRRLPWRSAVSLAAAAALGAVAVLAIRPGVPEMTGAAPVALTAVSQPAVVPVSAPPVETQYADLDDENARQLRNYLMTYSQSRGETLGYARYAAYTDDRKTDRSAERQR